MISFLHQELERNWVCAQTDKPERAANIKEMPNPLLRVGELTMLHVSGYFPHITSLVLQRKFPSEGTEFEGAGSQHTVLSSDDTVTKVNRASVFMTESERVTLAQRSRADHLLMQSYLGNTIVDQNTFVDTHPLNKSKRAVQHRQAKMDFEPVCLFPAYERNIDPEQLERNLVSYPGIEDALGDLATSGLRLYRDHALIPDVSGLNNIVLSQGELVNLDGLPVRADEDPNGADRIASLLADLRHNL